MSAVPPSNGPNDSLEMTERVTGVRSETGDVENQINGGLEDEAEEMSSLLGPRNEGGAVEQENLAEMEIQSRLWIKRPGNEKFREALKTWQDKDTLFASRVDRKRKQSNSLRNEIYQLIGFYLVFQGVLMTAVAQSNLLRCHNWWTAFFLSLLASVVTVGGVIQKFISSIALEKTIASESFSRTLCIKRVNRLLQLRENFDFQKDAKDPPEVKTPPAQTKLWVSAIVVTSILLVFSALFLASVRQILCDPGLSAPSPAPNSG